jgi:iron complex transport system substrate-binding protein
MFAALLLTRTLAFAEAQRIVSVAGAITGIVQTVRSVVEALDQSPDGERLATRLHAELDTALRLADAAQTRPKVLFLMSAGRGAPLASGYGAARTP